MLGLWGGPEAPWNSGGCGNNPGGVPVRTRQRVLADSASAPAPVPSKSGPQCPLRTTLGLHFHWKVSLHHPQVSHPPSAFDTTSQLLTTNCDARVCCLVSENVSVAWFLLSPGQGL